MSSRIAWAESPLQLLSAAEHADRSGALLRVVFRLGPQMSETAAELLRRGAPFSACVPYVGIPWRELARADEWIVGDAFSGQFQLAASVLRPRSVTLLDDGDMTLRIARRLTDSAPFARDDGASAVRRTIGDLARDHLAGLAAGGRLRLATVYDGGAFESAIALGLRIEVNRFDWLRRTAARPDVPEGVLVLGTARAADGLADPGAHLELVRRCAAESSVVYLPHRRQPVEHLASIAAIPSVTVLERNLPVELVLAGGERLDIRSPGGTAETTLAVVLAGSGSRIRPLDASAVPA